MVNTLNSYIQNKRCTMMFKRRKDGSLNLSIQAIVILVMAMAILGLGLGFIRTLMGQGMDELSGSLVGVDLDNPPSADKPIENEPMKVKSNKESTFKIGVYNDGDFTTSTAKVRIALGECIPVAGNAITVVSLPQAIEVGSYGTYQAKIQGNSAPPNEYLCEIIAQGLLASGANSTDQKTKQVTLTVTP